jgi:hypothetical protein
MNARKKVLVGLSLATLAVGLGAAQPEDRSPVRRARDAQPGPAEDPALLRARIERSIEQSQAMLERQRDALARLDAGDSPIEVLRSMRWREFNRGPDLPATRTPDETGEPDRRRERPGTPRDEARPGADLTPEARARLRSFLRDNLPSVHEQLEQVERADEQIGARLFDRLVPQLREVAMDMEREPAFGRLKLEELRAGLAVVDATQRMRSLGTDAPAEQRAEAERGVRDAIAARFDARMRLREHELERLTKRIAELHDQIKSELEGRDAEIDRVYQSVMSQRWARPTDRPTDRPADRATDRPGDERRPQSP